MPKKRKAKSNQRDLENDKVDTFVGLDTTGKKDRPFVEPYSL